MSSPPLNKTHKSLFVAQIVLRVLAVTVTFVAGWLMITSKETADVFGIQLDARYSYSSAFKFFAIANFIAFGMSIVSLLITFLLGRSAVDPKYYFYIFLHDLVISSVLIAGCSSATAIAFVGKYGNEHTGWMAICDSFAKFCNRVQTSAIFSYFGFIFYLILTIISVSSSSRKA